MFWKLSRLYIYICIVNKSIIMFTLINKQINVILFHIYHLSVLSLLKNLEYIYHWLADKLLAKSNYIAAGWLTYYSQLRAKEYENCNYDEWTRKESQQRLIFSTYFSFIKSHEHISIWERLIHINHSRPTDKPHNHLKSGWGGGDHRKGHLSIVLRVTTDSVPWVVF